MATRIIAPGGASTPAQGIVFRQNSWKGEVHSVDGTLPASGALMTIQACPRLGEIDLMVLLSGISCSIRLSPADARAVASELRVAASAVDAKQGRA
ncbi:MAG: hypothetical protein QM777_16940 [Pseudorhodoferax sp.]